MTYGADKGFGDGVVVRVGTLLSEPLCYKIPTALHSHLLLILFIYVLLMFVRAKNANTLAPQAGHLSYEKTSSSLPASSLEYRGLIKGRMWK